jgi:hypothetical protein
MHFAHSVEGQGLDTWQPLAGHLQEVSILASSRGQKFGAAPLAALGSPAPTRCSSDAGQCLQLFDPFHTHDASMCSDARLTNDFCPPYVPLLFDSRSSRFAYSV